MKEHGGSEDWGVRFHPRKVGEMQKSCCLTADARMLLATPASVLLTLGQHYEVASV